MKVVTIGRSHRNQVIFNDPSVSRVHCQIIQHDNGTFTIVDFKSLNGTFVNGHRVYNESHLSPGDSVRVGKVNVPWQSYFSGLGSDVTSSSKRLSGGAVAGIVFGALSLVAAIVLLVVMLVNGRPSNNNYNGSNNSYVSNASSSSYNTTNNTTNNTSNNTTYNFNTTYNVTVNSGNRYETLFSNAYPELERLRSMGIGGCKMLGETCADAIGDHGSVASQDRPSVCGTPADLGMCVDDSPHGVFLLLLHQKIRVTLSVVHSDLFTMYVYYTIENNTDADISVVIGQGSMLEVTSDDVQNLTVSETSTVTLKAREVRKVKVNCYCASEHRKSPEGCGVRVTPYKLVAAAQYFRSQESIWQWQADIYRAYVARY